MTEDRITPVEVDGAGWAHGGTGRELAVLEHLGRCECLVQIEGIDEPVLVQWSASGVLRVEVDDSPAAPLVGEPCPVCGMTDGGHNLAAHMDLRPI